MKNILLIFIVLFLGFSVSNAQNDNPIYTAVPSLSITPDARGGGMGDVGVATSPDVYSQYYNPAKYAFIQHDAGISLSYNLYAKTVSNIYLGYLSAYYKLDKKSVLSTSLRYFSLGEISLFDEYGMLSGTSNPFEMAFDAALSRKLTPNFSVAAALRLLYSDIGNEINIYGGSEMYSGRSLALDLAGYYQKSISFASGAGKLATGLNISNIGSKISYDDYSTSHFIPTNMRLGASFDYPFSDEVSLKLSADANKLLVPTPDGVTDFNSMSVAEGILRSFSDAPGGVKEELQEIMWSVGSELSFEDIYFLRGGYCYENEHKGYHRYFTLGAGLSLYNVQLDASYLIAASHSTFLDRTIRVSLSFNFQ